MDLSLEARRAAQVAHARRRARERYGLYLDEFSYRQLIVDLRRDLSKYDNGGKPSTLKWLGEQEGGKVAVLKYHWCTEWMFIIYDRETTEIRTFLPRYTKFIKNMDVSAS